ncbi:hypothetical protein SLS62_000231 [Diatrype stigma]|uniref:AB hydrolase-1 domain-containing protein n=1 Tax=Diatrype stigma TaxID=117547 RepID=A0AAN9VCY6_9PEZI
MHRFFRGDFFNFEVIRLLGTTRYGGADVAEVLEAVGNIRENDPITWHKAWSEQAKRTGGLAHEAEEHGHRHAAKMALLRASNYTLFTFEGPGQGLTLHEKEIPMRPDWEVLSDLVLDYLFKWAEDRNIALDPDRVAVAGASLAGYFALRASAGTRYKACVAIDPVQDLWEFATDHVSPGFLGLWNRGWIADWVVDKMIILGTRFSFQMRWEIYTTARFLGVTTPTEILRTMKQFTLRTDRGSRLDEVKCPVLVAGAANSLYFDVDKHSLATYERLGAGIKELWVATHPGEGSLQAKMGALALCNQRVFQFLDKQFGISRT